MSRPHGRRRAPRVIEARAGEPDAWRAERERAAQLAAAGHRAVRVVDPVHGEARQPEGDVLAGIVAERAAAAAAVEQLRQVRAAVRRELPRTLPAWTAPAVRRAVGQAVEAADRGSDRTLHTALDELITVTGTRSERYQATRARTRDLLEALTNADTTSTPTSTSTSEREGATAMTTRPADDQASHVRTEQPANQQRQLVERVEGREADVTDRTEATDEYPLWDHLVTGGYLPGDDFFAERGGSPPTAEQRESYYAQAVAVAADDVVDTAYEESRGFTDFEAAHLSERDRHPVHRHVHNAVVNSQAAHAAPREHHDTRTAAPTQHAELATDPDEHDQRERGGRADQGRQDGRGDAVIDSARTAVNALAARRRQLDARHATDTARAEQLSRWHHDDNRHQQATAGRASAGRTQARTRDGEDHTR